MDYLQKYVIDLTDEIMRQYRGHFLEQLDVPQDNDKVAAVLSKQIWFVETVAASHTWTSKVSDPWADATIVRRGRSFKERKLICFACGEERYMFKPADAGDDALVPGYYYFVPPWEWRENFCRGPVPVLRGLY